jgi:hypothetical protein
MGHGAEGMKYRFQWNFPIIFSKHNPKKLYTFSNQVHVTENEGQSWDIISPDLTRNDPKKLKSSGGPITQDNTSVEYYCTIFAAQESSLKEGLIWVGSDDGLIHVTKNGGETWDNVTPKNMPDWTMINSIEPSTFDPGTCYVAGTRYKSGDFNPYLYKTTDYGKSWSKITKGIDEEHFTRVLREDPANKNRFITTGIWSWSQHPNYFGEITLWLGVAVLAYPVLSGWQLATLISPIFVYLLLTKVSGIPLLDDLAKQKWGSDLDYLTYTQITSKLILVPPKR